jgi:phage pi2 protein 07
MAPTTAVMVPENRIVVMKDSAEELSVKPEVVSEGVDVTRPTHWSRDTLRCLSGAGWGNKERIVEMGGAGRYSPAEGETQNLSSQSKFERCLCVGISVAAPIACERYYLNMKLFWLTRSLNGARMGPIVEVR